MKPKEVLKMEDTNMKLHEGLKAWWAWSSEGGS